jgi:hypothetical protein
MICMYTNNCFLNIVTYEGFAWLIITGSGLDDWIYWHFFTITITTAHNQWLPKTRSIPYWTTSVFSSTVTDLVLIYESVTSSVSVVRWLALHKLNFWILLRLIHWTPLRISQWIHEWTLFYNSGRTEERSRPRTVRLLLRLFVAARTCLPNRCQAMDYSAFIRCHGNVPTEPPQQWSYSSQYHYICSHWRSSMFSFDRKVTCIFSLFKDVCFLVFNCSFI